MKHSHKQSGFTLVELAIVLVIIGLIVGGVLVGQDLIRAATLRSVITDVEKYNAAATTFRGKYDGLPGDLLNTRAVQFGFNATDATDAARDGTAGHGDGNSLISGCASASSTNIGCETALFWVDLTNAHLIPERSTLTSITGVAQASLATAALADGILPKTRLRDTALVTVFPQDSRNFFAIGQFSTAAAGAVTVDEAMNPLEAGSIDSKLDDGEPLTGTVTAITALGTLDTAGGASGCVATGTEHYNTTTDTLAGTVACSISLRASF